MANVGKYSIHGAHNNETKQNTFCVCVCERGPNKKPQSLCDTPQDNTCRIWKDNFFTPAEDEDQCNTSVYLSGGGLRYYSLLDFWLFRVVFVWKWVYPHFIQKHRYFNWGNIWLTNGFKGTHNLKISEQNILNRGTYVCTELYNYTYTYWLLLDLQLLHFFCWFWDLFASKISITIRNWRARYFEKMFLKLYWPDCFLNLHPIALICARLRLFAPEIAAMLFAPNRSQILNMLAISDFDNDPGYICSNAPKVPGSKK